MATLRNLLSVLILLLSGSVQLHAHSTENNLDHSLNQIFEHPSPAGLGFQKTWTFHVKSIPALHERENEKSNLLNKDEDDEDETTFLKKHWIVENKYFLTSFYPETIGYIYHSPKIGLSSDRHIPYFEFGRDRHIVLCVFRI